MAPMIFPVPFIFPHDFDIPTNRRWSLVLPHLDYGLAFSDLLLLNR